MRHPRIPSENDEIQTIRDIAAARDRWDKERRAKPMPSQICPKPLLILSWEHARYETAQMLLTTKLPFFHTSIGHDVSFSTRPIEHLSPVLLRDMQTHFVNKGRYLLCRVLTRPDRKIGTELLVEDTAGGAIFLALYNFPGLFQATQDTLDAFLPLGQLLVIREPWMKQPAAGAGHSMLRVDSPSDVIFLSGTESLVRNASWNATLPRVPYTQDSALTLKARGTTYFKAKLFLPAARLWTLAIQKDALLPEPYLNRAQAYIALGWYEAALRDAQYFLDTFPSSALVSKAVYRVASAEYGLGYYRSALKRFETIKDIVGEWEDKCRKRIREAEEAKYDWAQMFLMGQRKFPRLDVASFTGPISVQPIPGRGGGRGVLSTRDVTAGEILIVAKPFASVFAEDLVEGETNLAMNFLTNKMNDEYRLALIHRVVAKLYGCPERVNEVYDLYGGPTFNNSPTSYDSAPQPQLRRLETPLVAAVDLDIQRITSVVSFNVFGLCPVQAFQRAPNGARPVSEVMRPDTGSAALHTLPSLFNHACNSNARWFCFGDVIVIKAVKDIPVGTEITISYASGVSIDERGKMLKGFLEGRPCDCSLCVWDRSDGKRARDRRAELMRQWGKSCRSRPANDGGANVKSLESTIQQIKTTNNSQAQRSVHLELFYLHLDAMQSYQQQAARGRSDALIVRSIEHGFEALICAGFLGVDTSLSKGTKSSKNKLPLSKETAGSVMADLDITITAMLYLSRQFVDLGNLIRSERWFRAAWWKHNVVFGGEQALFSLRFGKYVEELGFPPTISNMKYCWD